MNKIKNDKRSIIFYGVSENAKRKFSKWVSEGLVPECFADADTNKHYTEFEGIEILPLNEAVNRYPDYSICITHLPQRMLAIRNYLIEKGIPAERIVTAEPYEYRKGCSWMGKVLVLTDTKVTTCCTTYQFRNIEQTGVIETDFKNYTEYCQNMLNRWRKNEPTHCDNCNCLKVDYWEFKPELTTINIATSREDDCNFRCSYCIVNNYSKGYFVDITREEHSKRHEYVLSVMRFFQNVSPNIAILYNAGEITISPYCDELINFWRENKMNVILFSNMSVYKTNLTEASCKGNISVLTSLDAGTPETFTKIKRIDCFDKVVGNLKRFSDGGGKIILKFIMLPGINDNKKDIDGFFDIAKQVNASIRFANDTEDFKKAVSENTLEMSIYFVNKCYERGFPRLGLFAHNISPNTAVILQERINELWG